MIQIEAKRYLYHMRVLTMAFPLYLLVPSYSEYKLTMRLALSNEILGNSLQPEA